MGDPTLSAKEIIGNESQERMGLVVEEKAINYIQQIAERERSPMYTVGETTNDMKFVFEQAGMERNLSTWNWLYFWENSKNGYHR